MSAHINTVSEILVSARALLANPGVWAKGDGAGNLPDGCYCAALAMWLYTPPGTGRVALDFFCEANAIRRFVSRWNDAPERTLPEVLTAFDKAIELAGARQ